MLKKIVSRHVISNGGRFRILQGSSIALLLECGHAALGTKSEDGAREHTACRMCESSEALAVKSQIQRLEEQLRALKKSVGGAGQASDGARKDRTELKKQLLGLLAGAKRATARELGHLAGESCNTVGKTLFSMEAAGHVKRVGKTPDGLVIWTAPTPGQLAALFKEVYQHETPQQGLPVG